MYLYLENWKSASNIQSNDCINTIKLTFEF